MSLAVLINITVCACVQYKSRCVMSFLSFLRKISNKEKEIFISEERFFSLLEKVSAFDVVRQWTENGGHIILCWSAVGLQILNMSGNQRIY